MSLDLSITLQNHFRCSSENKVKALIEKKSNNDVTYFANKNILYNTIINIKDKESFPQYNEYAITFDTRNNFENKEDLEKIKNKYLKLFIDIDADKNFLLEKSEGRKTEESLITQFKIQNSITSNDNNISIIVSHLIESLINFLLLDKIIEKKIFKENNLTNLDHIKKTNKTYSLIKDLIYKNVTITKSNSTSKYSYHIFFNNIVFKAEEIIDIKNIIINFKKNNSNNIFINYIDEQVYKNNPMLRFIYSIKEKNDTKYHIPLNTNYNNNNLTILDEELTIDKDNITNYLFSYTQELKEYIIIELQNKSDSKNNLKEKFYQVKLNKDENADIFFLRLKDIFYMIYKKLDKSLALEFNNIISNKEYF